MMKHAVIVGWVLTRSGNIDELRGELLMTRISHGLIIQAPIVTAPKSSSSLHHA
ncbi:hypothetical protein [Pusillimonas sp. ANT_WB101]|uniref:hypothetical protein n=1 Tax=Pusillimonas sp. ANT_WB101 TaxID=2597356 RepID=UPI00165D3971|nr:hypothetical protein [Pusillimonas sp. ANT_WB101]